MSHPVYRHKFAPLQLEPVNYYVEDDPVPEYRHASSSAYEAFRDMKYGIRIHWGVYALQNVEASWPLVLKYDNAQRQEYQQLYQRFNPKNFDANRWMKFFARNGLKMFTFTTKHADGFCMFDTKSRVKQRVNWLAPGGAAIEECDLAYSVMDSPFQRDIVKELCDAAHAHGIKIDLYFSHPDWYDADFRNYFFHPIQTPAYIADRKAFGDNAHFHMDPPAMVGPDPTPRNLERMMARYRQQVTELLTHYGKIDMMCLDCVLGPKAWPYLRQIILDARKLQPDVMFRDRGIGNYGDYYTPEDVVPDDKAPTPAPWFVIERQSDTFAFDPVDEHYKKGVHAIHRLADIVAKGGNFMVAVGPDAEGNFHPKAVEAIEETGRWLAINGEAIFATRPREGDLWKQGDHVRFTRSKDNRFTYALCTQWPGDKLHLDSVRARHGSKLHLLGETQPICWRRQGDGVTIDLPFQARPEQNGPWKHAWAFKIENEPAAPQPIRLDRLPTTDDSYNRVRYYIEDEPAPEYRRASAQAVEAFRDMKYGVRIHWGVYALKRIEASWSLVLDYNHAQRQEYQQLYRQFNPKHFNADAWMKWFSDCGMKMFAFTTKHSDGFSMFDTKANVKQRVNWTAAGGPAIEDCDHPYSVMESPFRRDIVKELCDAGRRHKLAIDLYYSHPDWYDADFRNFALHPIQTPEYQTHPEYYGNGTGVNDKPVVMFDDPTQQQLARMMQRYRDQLIELLSHYGKIDMLCLDMTLGPKVWPALRTILLEARKLQPDVMFRARGIGNYGDYYTPEDFIPGDKEPTTVPWFVIDRLGKLFSFDPVAEHYRGGDWIVGSLIESVSKGGNFMVCVGPDADGQFHPRAIEAIEAAGAWLKINGRAIYNTRERDGDLWREGDAVRFTRSKDGRTIYVIAKQWPGRELRLSTVRPRSGSSVRVLGFDRPLTWRVEDGATVIELPESLQSEKNRPCRFAWAIEMENG